MATSEGLGFVDGPIDSTPGGLVFHGLDGGHGVGPCAFAPATRLATEAMFAYAEGNGLAVVTIDAQLRGRRRWRIAPKLRGAIARVESSTRGGTRCFTAYGTRDGGAQTSVTSCFSNDDSEAPEVGVALYGIESAAWAGERWVVRDRLGRKLDAVRGTPLDATEPFQPLDANQSTLVHGTAQLFVLADGDEFRVSTNSARSVSWPLLDEEDFVWLLGDERHAFALHATGMPTTVYSIEVTDPRPRR